VAKLTRRNKCERCEDRGNRVRLRRDVAVTEHCQHAHQHHFQLQSVQKESSKVKRHMMKGLCDKMTSESAAHRTNRCSRVSWDSVSSDLRCCSRWSRATSLLSRELSRFMRRVHGFLQRQTAKRKQLQLLATLSKMTERRIRKFVRLGSNKSRAWFKNSWQ